MGLYCAFLLAVDLFSILFLFDKDTSKSSETPVFPRMLKIGQTNVYVLSDPALVVLIECLPVSASRPQCKHENEDDMHDTGDEFPRSFLPFETPVDEMSDSPLSVL